MRDVYENPLNTRYASKEMLELFSPQFKFRTWRRLWIALAESQQELGLNITDEQIEELKRYKDDINYELAEEIEKETRHDVMSHVHAYGAQCEKAKGIIHLGATSCYVADNTDVITYYEALKLVKRKTLSVISKLSRFAEKYMDMPTLGFTHYQPAQLVTVGKRTCLWIMDLLLDIEELDFVIDNLRLLGNKGTTGTQASFLALFDGNHEKVVKLENIITKKLGFTSVMPVSGQTYSRKQDSRIINVLSAVAQSTYKFSNDMRLLANLKEMEEPFEKKQIGSSAMAYKRNPMRSERISSLARYVVVNALNPAITASTQWLERTLDDSANKRISMPEAFLAVDSILNIYNNIADGIVVYPKIINRRIMEELPFMATENILMEAVKRGGDRQVLHEKIRVHSLEAARMVKEEGKSNDLIQRIANDSSFGMTIEELDAILAPENFIGRCVEQVTDFISQKVSPVLKKNHFEEEKIVLRA